MAASDFLVSSLFHNPWDDHLLMSTGSPRSFCGHRKVTISTSASAMTDEGAGGEAAEGAEGAGPGSEAAPEREGREGPRPEMPEMQIRVSLISGNEIEAWSGNRW